MDNEIETLKKQVQDLQDRLHAKQTEYDPIPLNEEETEEYSWDAPIRIFNQWERKKVTTVFLWVMVLGLILLFLREFVLFITIVLIALVSLSLVVIAPGNTKHKLTNKGIFTYDKLYLWDDLDSFWLAQRKGGILMIIRTKLTYPTQLLMVLPEGHIPEVLHVMTKHLKYYQRREKQGNIGRIADGIYIPFEDIKNLSTSKTTS